MTKTSASRSTRRARAAVADHPDRLTAAEAVARVRRDDREIVTFIGYSGAGYEDEAAMIAAVREELSRHEPREVVVNAGATAEGIGAVYRIAKELGFATSGIVSSRALESESALSESLDRLAVVEDDTWGGFLPGTDQLSPTSRAMVEASDRFVAIGGGKVGRDELIVARQAGKPIRFVPADMNHEAARKAARKEGREAPTDFRGPVHEMMCTP
jgi:hypothetical protein